MQLVPKADQPHEWSEYHAHQRAVGHQLANRQFLRHDQPRADGKNRNADGSAKDLTNKSDQYVEALRPVFHVEGIGKLPLPFHSYRSFDTHSLDRLDPADRFHQRGLRGSRGLEDLARISFELGCSRNGQNHYGHDHNQQQRRQQCAVQE